MVTIIIPCYNHGKYLLEAVENLEPKSNEFYEVIIVNDGSTDKETLEAFDLLEEKGFNIIHQKNKGLANARNIAIENSTREYILPLDADNIISIDYIKKSVKILNNDKSIGVVYSDLHHFGKLNDILKLPDFIPERFLSVNYIDACAVYRKSIWEKAGGYDVNMPFQGYEDWELWINAFKQGYKFHHISESLFKYRVRDDSMVTNSNKPGVREKLFTYIINKHENLYSKYKKEVPTYLIENQAKLEELYFSNVELVNELNFQLKNSIETIHSIQTRINEIENSMLWKFKKRLDLIFQRVKSNSASNNSFFSKLFMIFSKKTKSLISLLFASIFKHLYLLFESKKVMIVDADKNIMEMSSNPYIRYLHSKILREKDILKLKQNIENFKIKPTFSIIMPVYNPPINFFKKAIESILIQAYESWELCIADDCSTNPEVKKTIEYYAQRNSRIKVKYRKENGHISKASNSALELATGDYIVLMDNDDVLAVNALYENAKLINEHPDADLIYSDEDKIDEKENQFYPHFKPDWSPDSLLSRNYLGHLTVFRATIFNEIGGWREGFDGSQDYDLVLRYVEQTENIYHISEILYHWRVHSTSAAGSEDAKPYAYISAQKALTEALVRRDELGNVSFLDDFRGYSIRYKIKDTNKKVSIIIPTKDKTDVLSVCIESIISKSTYKNFEIIIVDNNSSESKFFEFIEKWKTKEPERFKYVKAPILFNFSRLINIGYENSDGDYLILLNNDTEVISPDWIEGMIEQAQRPSIGVVGCKLLYPNETIQHAGVIIGMGGVAGHALVGQNRNGPGYFNYVNMSNNYCALTAACVMVRRDVFEEVNKFDEDFSVEYNDVDFCLKIREAGYNNIYLPHVELFHHESITRGHPHATKESYERHLVEVEMFKSKWMKYIEHDPCYNENLTLGAADFAIKE